MATSASGHGRSKRSSKPTSEWLGEGLPPQSADAEKAVLGSVLRDPTCLLDLVKKVRPDDFYAAAHQAVFQSAIEMFEAGKPIDVVSVAEELNRKDQLLEVGGAPFLMNLIDGVLTSANSSYHANTVYEKSVLRQLIHTCTDILRDAYQHTSEPEELLASAEKRIFAILEKRISGDAQNIKDVLMQAFTRLEERQARGPGSHLGVPTGFLDLDDMTDGWKDSELIILAARPSMGKTALALNFVEEAAVNHKMPVLFCSLEMSNLELVERMLFAKSKVNGHAVRRSRISGDDMQKLIFASQQLSEAPLYIDDTPGQDMLRISATARRLKHRHGLSMIVIDYLQLIEPDDKSASRVEQISVISRRLKNLARELRVPVMALSQLNRGVESREGHKPRMSDLRESGSIEQDADVVLLLHRPDFYDKEDKPGQAELIIAKQRNGPVGDVPMVFLKESTRFESFHQDLPTFRPTH